MFGRLGWVHCFDGFWVVFGWVGCLFVLCLFLEWFVLLWLLHGCYGVFSLVVVVLFVCFNNFSWLVVFECWDWFGWCCLFLWLCLGYGLGCGFCFGGVMLLFDRLAGLFGGCLIGCLVVVYIWYFVGLFLFVRGFDWLFGFVWWVT